MSEIFADGSREITTKKGVTYRRMSRQPKGHDTPPAVRFALHVDKAESGCWLWTGYILPTGYGAFLWNRKVGRVHRYSWELAHGPIPEGLWVLHHCDVRRCVNPAHLFLGTRQDNENDKVAKGRQIKGAQHHATKVTAAAVIAIRQSAEFQAVLAARYGICQQTVSDIKRGRYWKHV